MVILCDVGLAGLRVLSVWPGVHRGCALPAELCCVKDLRASLQSETPNQCEPESA